MRCCSSFVDVEYRAYEVCYFSGMIYVYHVEALLLGEQGVVFAHLLHLGQNGPGKGLDLGGVALLILEVLDRRYHRITGAQGLLDAKAFEGADKDVHPAIGQIDFLYDFGHGPHLVKVVRWPDRRYR